MATITSSGAGSGLNVNSLVTQLVAAERAPYDQRITRTETRITTEFSALAQLKGAMVSFQGALANLKKNTDFELRTTTVGNKDLFDAAAGAASAAGTYGVEVRQLAKASQLGSAAVTGGASAVIGTGTLNIAMGSQSFNVTLADGSNTLANLRDAINAAPTNTGVQATLIADISGAHLILTGSLTGAANALRVTTTGGDGGLTQFVYNPPTTTNLTPLSVAQDAIVFVSGYEIHDVDNNIESAIDGVTLKLKKAQVGEVTTLTVATNNSGISERVNTFVNSYNVLANQMAKLRSYNSETRAAGPLLGDAMLRNIEDQLRRVIVAPVTGVTGSYTSLANLGITTTATGTLSLDQARFDAALVDDPTAATHVFAAEPGVATRLDAFLTAKLSTTGELASRDAGVTARRKDIASQKAALDMRMEVIQARYMRQFNALDSMLTKLQSTSSYLSQQLAAAAAQQ